MEAVMSAITERSSTGAAPRKKRVSGEFVKIANTLSNRLVKTLSALPEEQQRRIKREEKALAEALQTTVEAFVAAAGKPPETVKVTKPAVRRTGKGLGTPLSTEDARESLMKYATPQRLEDWAGEVAGASQIERELGISRSTLYSWTTRGAVISLKAGHRRHVYPLAQFIDSRPVEGVEEILRISRNARAAWQWLVQDKPNLGGQPLALLKAGKTGDVIDAAEQDFG